MVPGMTERRNSRSRDLQSPFSCDPLPPAQPHLLRAYRSPNSACHQRRNKPLKHEPVGGISDSNHKKVPPLEILQDYSAWGGGASFHLQDCPHTRTHRLMHPDLLPKFFMSPSSAPLERTPRSAVGPSRGLGTVWCRSFLLRPRAGTDLSDIWVILGKR